MERNDNENFKVDDDLMLCFSLWILNHTKYDIQ